MFVDFEQKQTGITSDTIRYTTHTWQEFEIGEKKVIYFSSLIGITKDFFLFTHKLKTNI